MANNEVETGKKPEMVEPEQESSGQYLLGYCSTGVSSVGSNEDKDHCKENSLMAAVIETENMREALRRVKRNRGAAGVDGNRHAYYTGEIGESRRH